MTTHFQPGDTVRLKSGRAPQTVIAVDVSRMKCSYTTHGDRYPMRWRRCSDYVHFEEEEPMTKLYQTNEMMPRYGTFLTKDSQGRIVLEMKPEGKVEAYDPDTISEVLPHTVEIKNFGEGRTRHIVSREGLLSVDDILLECDTGLVWRVVGLNTKVRKPTIGGKWIRIAGETLDMGDDS